MKTRHGFVSNSSSSSFIVALDKDHDGVVELTFKVDLSRHGKTLSTIEELDEKFIRDNGYIVNKDGEKTIEDVLMASDAKNYGYREEYDKYKALIESGKKVITGQFCDDSGDPEEIFLCYSGLNNTVKEDSGIEIIEGEGGY